MIRWDQLYCNTDTAYTSWYVIQINVHILIILLIMQVLLLLLTVQIANSARRGGLSGISGHVITNWTLPPADSHTSNDHHHHHHHNRHHHHHYHHHHHHPHHHHNITNRTAQLPGRGPLRAKNKICCLKSTVNQVNQIEIHLENPLFSLKQKFVWNYFREEVIKKTSYFAAQAAAN